MSNELATLSALTSLPVPAAATAVDLTEYSSGLGEFLKTIQLNGMNKFVKAGKITPGRYGIPQPTDEDGLNIVDLGESIDVLPLASRYKALDYGADPVIVCYDKEDAVYKDIVARADKYGQDSKCLYGPSILILERKTIELYEWFLINQSSREEAPKIMPFLPIFQETAELFGVEPKAPEPVTLSARMIKRKKGEWHIPVISKCSVPFTELPPNEFLIDQITKFTTAKPQTPELAKEEEGERSV